MVGRPWVSAEVVTSPRGLWNRKSRVRSRCGSGLPSTAMRSAAVTLSAGDVIVAPFTDTRPAAIQASASRREATPARAITLAMRSADFAGCAACSGSGRGSEVASRLPRNLRPRCLGLSSVMAHGV